MGKSADPGAHPVFFVPAGTRTKRPSVSATWCRTAFSIGVLISILMCLSCSGKKIYSPPEKEGNKIVLINSIYDSGFYVELDGQEAGFLKDRLEIGVTPGKHKLKIYNNETDVGEKPTSTEHKFNLKIEVAEQEVKEIYLNWDDPNYSRETKRETIKLGEKKKEKKQERPGINMPGGGMGGGL
jgi:hypothetical protein